MNAQAHPLIETSCFICISGNFNASVKEISNIFSICVSVGHIKVIEAICILPEF